jgi:hypothetical protein
MLQKRNNYANKQHFKMPKSSTRTSLLYGSFQPANYNIEHSLPGLSMIVSMIVSSVQNIQNSPSSKKKKKKKNDYAKFRTFLIAGLLPSVPVMPQGNSEETNYRTTAFELRDRTN